MQEQKIKAKKIDTLVSNNDYFKIKKIVNSGAFVDTKDFVRSAVRDKLQETEVIEIRDVSFKQAKKEILTYYQQHNKAYPSDVANSLGIDLQLAYQVVDELIKEGKIGE